MRLAVYKAERFWYKLSQKWFQMNKERELATLMIMTNILFKLGNSLTKTVNSFRRKLRKMLNHMQKHDVELYRSSLKLATATWESVNKNNHTDMSVASTLDSLNLLIEDCIWVKKIYTQKQFQLVYASIVQDKPVSLTAQIEANSKKFTDELGTELGFKKKKNLKLLIKKIKDKQ